MAIRENDTIQYDITQNIAIRYDMMHKCKVKFNALQRWRQFVKEHLLLLQRAWPVQQDDNCSETADMGTCADNLKRGRMVGNVDWRQHDISISDNGDATMVHGQVVSYTRSRMIDDVGAHLQGIPSLARIARCL